MTAISINKFMFSSEYREGVNDALDELIAFQINLLSDSSTSENCEKIYDELVELVYDAIEEYNADGADCQIIWNIFYSIVYRTYKRSLEKINAIKTLRRKLNQQLSSKNARNNVDPSTRFRVLKRDCFKCVYCGDSPSTDPKITLVVDHIQPIAKGGKNSLDNYQTLCQYCNAGKGSHF